MAGSCKRIRGGRPLGANQRSVLEQLKGSATRCWIPRGILSGWVWGTQGETVRILDSLVRRGLVVKGKDGAYRPKE